MVARVVSEEQEENTERIMQTLGWDARRMNPALAYLLECDLVMSSRSISHPLKTYSIKATDATRRFLKQAS